MSCCLCSAKTQAGNTNTICGDCISEHSNLINSLEFRIGGDGTAFYYGGASAWFNGDINNQREDGSAGFCSPENIAKLEQLKSMVKQ